MINFNKYRASALQAEGHWFEPSSSHQNKKANKNNSYWLFYFGVIKKKTGIQPSRSSHLQTHGFRAILIRDRNRIF